ncbi:MAG: 5-carboxymethyl-2-hydroxymuconate Delta-isomerase [Burkholderiaceae bacterium]
MPHLVIQYTANLDAEADMTALCRELAAVLVAQKDEQGQPLFPIGGTRVLAYPAPHYAVADGQRDYAFAYLNLRIAPGRPDALKKRAGDAILERAKGFFYSMFERRPIGLTLQIDESPGQVYDAKHSNIHRLFNNP